MLFRSPVRAGQGAAFWSILRDARLRLAPQDEGVDSPRQSTFTVNRTNFESGTLEPTAFGRIDGVSAPAPSCGGGQGWGSRGPRRLSNAPSLACRVGRRDPPPLSSPTRGEEAQRGDLRVNSKAEGSLFPWVWLFPCRGGSLSTDAARS